MSNRANTPQHPYRTLLLTIAIVFAIDQATKLWAQHYLRPPGPLVLVLIPRFLDVRYPDMWDFGEPAFLLRTPPPPAVRFTFLLAGVVLGLALIVGPLRRLRRRDIRVAPIVVCLGLQIAGVLGNVLDKLRQGRVVDFIVGHIDTREWPAFNLADVAITTGVGGWLLLYFILPIRKRYWKRGLRWWRFPRWMGTLLRGFSLLLIYVLSVGMQMASVLPEKAIAGALLVWPALKVGQIAASIWLQIFGRRLQQPSAEELLALDTRKPVLLLRSFRRDRERIKPRTRWARFAVWRIDYLYDAGPWTFERAVLQSLEQIGPVIALGDPDELVHPLGAARTYSSHEAWKERIREIMGNAQEVALLLDDSPSLRWELDEAIRVCGLSHVLLITAPGQTTSEWQALREAFPFLPPFNDKTAAIRFDPDNTPQPIIAPAPHGPWQRIAAIEHALATRSRGADA
jgi:signal peptidase II